MVELLVMLVLLTMFTAMVLFANRMLSTLIFEATSASQQQTLASVATSALLTEMRTATNITEIPGSIYRDANGNNQTDHANFAYDSKYFDYRQLDPTIKYQEIVFVDTSNPSSDTYGKLYVGCYNGGTAPTDSGFSSKPLFGGAMYSSCIISLNDDFGNASSTTVTQVQSTLGDANTDGNYDSATFQLALYIKDTTTDYTSSHVVNVNSATTT